MECGAGSVLGGPSDLGTRDLGVLSMDPLSESATIRHSSGRLYYRFSLEHPAMVDLDVGMVNASALSVRLDDDRAVADENVSLYALAVSPEHDRHLIAALPAGDFLVTVSAADGMTFGISFVLELGATFYEPAESEPEPGPSQERALNLGLLTSKERKLGGYVGAIDAEDYYHFSLDRQATVVLDGANIRGGGVAVQLFDGATVINENMARYSINPGARGDQRLSVPLPKGEYFVRVSATDGTAGALYTLRASAAPYGTASVQDPGPDSVSAHPLGTLSTEPELRSEYVGLLDAEDYFSFELRTPTLVTIDATNVLAGRITIQLFDDAQVINESAPRYSASASQGSDQRQTVPLPAGRYFVRVTAADGTIAALYALTCSGIAYGTSEPVPEPGSSKEAATELGPLADTKVVRVGGYLGLLDPEDYFGFSLVAPATVTIDAADVLGSRVNVQLFEDADIINEATPRFSTSAYPQGDQRLAVMLPAGVYYARVTPGDGTSGALYSLSFQATLYAPLEGAPDPGGDKATAFDLGALPEFPTDVAGYVGLLDGEDYYRFELDTAASVTIDGVQVNGGRITAQLFDDMPIINESAPRYSIQPSPLGAQRLATVLPAGAYFVRVAPADGSISALYTLSLSAVSYPVAELDPNPGAEKQSASKLGDSLDGPQTVGGYVGILDGEDYYRVDLTSPATLRIDCRNFVGGKGLVQLYADAEIINESSPMSFTSPYPGGDQRMSTALAAGTYFLRVVPLDPSVSLLYTLNVSAAN